MLPQPDASLIKEEITRVFQTIDIQPDREQILRNLLTSLNIHILFYSQDAQKLFLVIVNQLISSGQETNTSYILATLGESEVLYNFVDRVLNGSNLTILGLVEAIRSKLETSVG